MKIGIDARCFTSNKNTGVEEYTRQILMRLFVSHPEHTYHIYYNAWRGSHEHLAWMETYDHVTLHRTHYPNKLLNLALWYLHRPRIDRLLGGVDVFYAPNINFIALSPETPLILTMHDLSFERVAETFSWQRRLWHWLVNPRSLAARAAHVMTVSDATRDDLVDLWELSAERITRTYNGFTPPERTLTRNDARTLEIKSQYGLPYHYILYFGTVEPRKNIATLIRAYTSMRAAEPAITHQLVIAGAPGWKAAEIYHAHHTSPYRDDIMIIHDIPEEDKYGFYILADLFVYPSLFEGFGLPVLEALSAGIPVITSATTSLPEVGQDRTIMIDPYRPEELTTAMGAVLTDRTLAARLSETARPELLRRYSWSRAADATLAAMQEAVRTQEDA